MKSEQIYKLFIRLLVISIPMLVRFLKVLYLSLQLKQQKHLNSNVENMKRSQDIY